MHFVVCSAAFCSIIVSWSTISQYFGFIIEKHTSTLLISLPNSLKVPFNLGKETFFSSWESPFIQDTCRFWTGNKKQKKTQFIILMFFQAYYCTSPFLQYNTKYLSHTSDWLKHQIMFFFSCTAKNSQHKKTQKKA